MSPTVIERAPEGGSAIPQPEEGMGGVTSPSPSPTLPPTPVTSPSPEISPSPPPLAAESPSPPSSPPPEPSPSPSPLPLSEDVQANSSVATQIPGIRTLTFLIARPSGHRA